MQPPKPPPTITDAELARLRELTAEIERRRTAMPAAESLAEFTRQSWHVVETKEPYQHGRHIEAIAEHLEALYRGEIRNLIINVPPRHAKSSLSSVLFPAWVWQRDPAESFLFSSHAQSLSTRDSVRCRTLLQSDWYRRTFNVGWTLSDDQNTKNRYNNTAGGYRISTSVGGAGIGEGAGILIVDDPHDPVEAKKSATARQAVLDWWDLLMSSRAVNPRTVRRLVIMQRLAPMDLCGHLLQQGGWEHLCLPAEYEGNRSRISTGWTDWRTQQDELLWPERFGRTEVEAAKKTLGAQDAAGQLQQRPAPLEGLEVKRAWWRYWTELPPRFDEVIQSWDLTYKKTKTGAFVVGQVWGRLGADKYLVHQTKERWGFNEQIAGLLSVSAAFPDAGRKLLEDAANAQALLATVSSKVPGVVLVRPDGDKEFRAKACAPEIESGNVYLPPPHVAPWVPGFVEAWAQMPNCEFWDEIDAASQAIRYLSRRTYTDISLGGLVGASKWVS